VPAASLNSFGVSKSKVANDSEENPQVFVKPLVELSVLPLLIGETGNLYLPMAHNVLDAYGHEEEAQWLEPQARDQKCTPESQPNSA
jgi:hypothetical protein